MARSSDINQRITLTGADEVRRHLEQIGQAGDRAGNTIRASLQAATNPLNAFTRATQQSTSGTRSLQFAVTNLGFQVNDIATGLASGQDAMRIFAQQGGQVFQAFQQGGGLGVVFGAISASISGMITPLRLALAGAVALAGGFALIVARAENAQELARQFDVILKGIGDTGTTTGAQLEKAAEGLHDVGLSTSESRKLFQSAVQQGVKPRDVEKVVRIGKELNTVLGEGSLEKFISAAATGGAPLDEFAKRLHLVSMSAEDTVNAVFASSQAVNKFNNEVRDAIRATNLALTDESRGVTRSLEDIKRQTKLSIDELTRPRGTPQQEIELGARRQREELERQSARRIEDINRQNARAINDIIRKRNAEENQAALVEFNKQNEIAAQKALDTGAGIVDAIGRRVLGSFSQAQGSLARSMTQLSTAWSKLLDSLAQSEAIQSVVKGLDSMVTSITKLVQGEFSVEAFGLVLAAAVPSLILFRTAVVGISAALGPVGLILTLAGLVIAFADFNKAWEGAKAAADGFWTLMKALGAWLTENFFSIMDNWVITPIKNVIDWFDRLIKKTQEAASALNPFSRGGAKVGENLTAPAASGPGGFAAGGVVRGPGGTDNVPAWLTAGEFVTNAFATRANLPLLQAINSIGRSRMPRISTPRGFAKGGMVSAAGAARTPINLHIGSETFPLEADAGTAQRVIRFGKRKAMLSAGRLPSTA